jgi:transposase
MRDRVLAAYDRAMTTSEIAERLDVSPAWTRRVNQRRRETGETTARPMGGARVIKVDLERLKKLVAERPDATIVELHARLGVQCSQSAVGMALDRLDMTFKKRRSMLRSKTARMSPRSGIRGSVAKTRSMRAD